MGTPAGTPPLIALLGPTASGKTQAALELAGWLPVEIISMDSAQVYRGMDVGTAKPSAAERAAVPHHLIDRTDPTDAFSAARFAQEAAECVAGIIGRGRIPVLAGGTLLYYRALTEGLSDLPAANPAIRARIEARAADCGWEVLHAELARLDPAAAARIATGDSQRIQRALEVFELTGETLSALSARGRHGRLDLPRVEVVLEPRDRAVLHERIGRRFAAMLDTGLVEELQGLRARHALHAGLPSMRAVGYRQAWQYLDGEIDRAQLLAAGCAATRQLARRQLTWLRAMPGPARVACDEPGMGTAVRREVQAALAACGCLP